MGDGHRLGEWERVNVEVNWKLVQDIKFRFSALSHLRSVMGSGPGWGYITPDTAVM